MGFGRELGCVLFLILILMPQLNFLLIFFVYKPLFPGALIFIPSQISFRLPHLLGPAPNPKWPFMFPRTCWLRPLFFLAFLAGQTWPPLICSGQTCLACHFPVFLIINLYTLWTKRTSQMTVSPLVAFPDSLLPTLVVGDFNLNHCLPHPLRTHSIEDLNTSFPYLSR